MIREAKILMGYSKSGSYIGHVQYIELQWNRRFFAPGDFTVYMRFEDFDPNCLIYKLEDHTEVGMLLKYEYDEKPEGNFVTISGFFMEYIFNWQVCLLDKYWLNNCGRVADTNLTYLINGFKWELTGCTNRNYRYSNDKYNYFYGLDITMLSAARNVFNNMWVDYEFGKTFGDLIYKTCQEQHSGLYSIRVTPTYTNNQWRGIKVDAIKGIQGGDQTFSKSAGNIANLHYSRDESGMCNMVRVYNVENVPNPSDSSTTEKAYQLVYVSNLTDPTITSDTPQSERNAKNLKYREDAYRNAWWIYGNALEPSGMPDMTCYWLPENNARSQAAYYTAEVMEERAAKRPQHPHCFPQYGSGSSAGDNYCVAKAIQAQFKYPKDPHYVGNIIYDMQQQGQDELTRCGAVLEVSGTAIDVDDCVYMTDYDLGNLAYFVVQDLDGQTMISTQITEARELHHHNVMDLEIAFTKYKYHND